MSLTTDRILNRQSFTPLSLPQDVINGVHRLVRRNPRGLDIQDRDWRLFLEPDHGANNDDNNSTYAPSDDDNSDNKNKRGDNESDSDNNVNLNLPPNREMAQGTAGVTLHDNAGVHQNENVGVHQTTENSGVHQNANMHSPHNDPCNDPTIKAENTIDVTGNENEAEDEDKNEA